MAKAISYVLKKAVIIDTIEGDGLAFVTAPYKM